MHFENALGEKREKCVLKMHLEKKREKQMLKNVKKGETCENCEKM